MSDCPRVWSLVVLVAGSLAVAGCSGGDSTGTGGSSSSSTQTGAGGNATSSSTGVAPECLSASDCDAQFGASPCGAWACNAGFCDASSPGCVDADHDGYGFGPNCMCAGLDCDDSDPMLFSSGTRSCYSGANGTAGVGACLAGSQNCTQGVWATCIGQITPSGEACNTEDDDCNGTADDGLGSFACGLGVCATTVAACTAGAVGACIPGAPTGAIDGPSCNGLDDDCDGVVDEDCKSCVPVSPTGIDALGDGTFALPFLTIQAGINWAATHAAGPQLVCVAAGAVCGATGTYQNVNGQTVTMADGVSVVGNYESTTWNSCANSTTIIQPRTPEGVTFPATAVKVTALSKFRVDRFNSNTAAAVTVNGAKAAILSSVTISNTPAVVSSYGVNVVNGGVVTITKSRIDAGTGSTESIGVRSVGAKVNLVDNCLNLDVNGRCDDFCGGNPSIRGRVGTGPGTTYAVELQDSPGSLIQSSALCGNQADTGAVIRIGGASAGITIRGNNINAFGGLQTSYGIWMEDCNAAAPWIVDNFSISADGVNLSTSVDAVRAIGDCHPVIDSNLLIVGGGEGQASNPTAVHCGANVAKVASKCVVLGNKNIRGSHFGFPPVATGVRCELDGCNRVARNVITGRGGAASYGVWLESTSAVVDANLIGGGCSPLAVGVHAADAASRIQNNRIFGFTPLDCGPVVGQPVTSKGMEILLAAGPNEIDVSSNDIDGGGRPGGTCTTAAIELGAGTIPSSTSVGVFRNNILRAGTCAGTHYDVIETGTQADPRIFENNDLDPFQTPTALYFDENMTAVNTSAAVNTLFGTTGNISVDPLYVSYPTDLHLAVGSLCVGAGTPTGAPAVDFEGTLRSAVGPDIGADEQ